MSVFRSVQAWGRLLGRLPKLLYIALRYTIATNRQARRLPSEAQPLFRAQRQQEGCRFLCRIMGLEVDASNAALPTGTPGLLVANHLGALDPIVLATCWPVAFVGKAELRRWPLIGWLCRSYGVLFVARERRTQSAHFVQQVRARLQAGVPVLVFPEGTTSRGDAVQPFKTGAFEAVAGMPQSWVLPVSLCIQEVDGKPASGRERQWLAWHAQVSFVRHLSRWLRLRRARLQVRVGRPISTLHKTRKKLAQEAFEVVQGLYEAMLKATVDTAGPMQKIPASTAKQSASAAVSESSSSERWGNS